MYIFCYGLELVPMLKRPSYDEYYFGKQNNFLKNPIMAFLENTYLPNMNNKNIYSQPAVNTH